jgi:hypothetical protein
MGSIKTYKSLSEIKKANETLGHHFFNHDWLSAADPEIYYGRYFITADWFDLGTMQLPRKYTIRRADADGGISTVGLYMGYDSLKQAQEELKGWK